MSAYAAVVLAGGAARRLGGRDKPALPVGGVPMRERVLAAVADASPRILVGPGPAPPGVRLTRESPPGGGPVAATAAGLALLDADVPAVALLAADLPLLTRSAVGELLRHLDTPPAAPTSEPPVEPSSAPPAAPSSEPPVDGVCFVDDDGRRQSLCGVWRPAALRAALDRLTVRRGELAGAALRELLADLAVRELTWPGDGPAPWFDCDTERDLRQAEEWSR
ncbi:NTP transferase domain-containing protein [Micromonospora fiedleri]|uniref:NTP transferase domain-containing protein n=1 Tax=Micromonospora fiedleri TaxID=1157498 RepID=A0ABS1ULB5_9ACTN|nr:MULTISPECIES: NTP transferase domain-containing protein [Micromonospora]MBL6277137.1 NTP transferase domain-containing protein [Micromonospora fiedleri]WSK43166.1 NTP transferase domain-containing protein [Micromonospora maris]